MRGLGIGHVTLQLERAAIAPCAERPCIGAQERPAAAVPA
jgi:hypothetical protein